MNQHISPRNFVAVTPGSMDWQKRYILIARCDPSLWFQVVWARKVNGRWEYRKTQEELEIERDCATW